jgi:Cof subfamily protein (haloacid dehalogenase superfamily)
LQRARYSSIVRRAGLCVNEGVSVTYQLVALDLDGTVMGADLIVPPVVQEAIAAAQARGVQVTLATGRAFGATLPFARLLRIDVPVICYQGALVRHPVTGEIYVHTTMPGDAAAEAVATLLAAGIFVIAYIDERHHIVAHRPELDLYLGLHPEGGEIVVTPDLPALVRATTSGVAMKSSLVGGVAREVAALGRRFGDRLAVTRSHERFGELMAPGVSKGGALAALAVRLGVPREAVLAIGDQENDLSMLTWAGLGLAMGNAVPAVRAAAAVVLPPVGEAGVAWALREYVLVGQSGSRAVGQCTGSALR